MTNKLLCTRGNHNPEPGYTCNGTGIGINSQQFRFVSIVAHNPFPGVCTGIGLWKQNAVYKTLSSNLFNAPYTNGAPAPTSPGPLGPDTYNICDQSSFNNYLTNVNSSIHEEIIKHHYQFWPVATADPSIRINPDDIRVIKNGVDHVRLTPPVPPGSHGFTFDDTVKTVNTRSAPTPGEPFTGRVVELHGSARVTYPECLTVIFKEPNDLFGYIVLNSKPQEDSISVRINDKDIPHSPTNGWQLLKSGGQPVFRNEQNIKITSPPQFAPSSTEYVGGTPAVNKAGYVIQLFGDAIYTNGAVIDVNFLPSN